MRELLVLELGEAEHSGCLCDESFKQEKSALRKRLKAGEIDNLEYQRLLKKLVLLKKEYHKALWRARWFFTTEYESKGHPPLKIDDLNILALTSPMPILRPVPLPAFFVPGKLSLCSMPGRYYADNEIADTLVLQVEAYCNFDE